MGDLENKYSMDSLKEEIKLITSPNGIYEPKATNKIIEGVKNSEGRSVDHSR